MKWLEEENTPESSQPLKIVSSLLLSFVVISGYLYSLFILVAIYIVSMKNINKNERKVPIRVDSIIERDKVEEDNKNFNTQDLKSLLNRPDT